MFEHLHSSVKYEKMGFTIISDLQNNFDLSYLLMSNVSIERMCTFLMLTGTTFNYFLLIKKLRNLNLVQKPV